MAGQEVRSQGSAPPASSRSQKRGAISQAGGAAKKPRGDDAASDKKKAKKRLLFLNKQISSYGQRKQLGKALECYQQIVEVEGIRASAYTYTSLINAHVRSGDVAGAKATSIPSFSLSLWNQAHLLHYLILIFLHLCFRSGRQRWLTTMADAGVAPNVVAYTALLKGLCAEGDMNAAESLLRQMEKACHPDPS